VLRRMLFEHRRTGFDGVRFASQTRSNRSQEARNLPRTESSQLDWGQRRRNERTHESLACCQWPMVFCRDPLLSSRAIKGCGVMS
jgi:hypothetical protein